MARQPSPFFASSGRPRLARRGARSRRCGAFLTLLLACALVIPAPAAARKRHRPKVTQMEASRFLSQATLGAGIGEIRRVSRSGFEHWIASQRKIRPTYHVPIVRRRIKGVREDAPFDRTDWRRTVWAKAALTGRDALRQRVAFALSEIFVVSENLDALEASPYALPGYYDLLLAHAFGNYRDLLRAVVLSPAMGTYLSHANNQRSDPERGTFPDENFAREVMQLMSIGLHELNPDGTRKLDVNGDPIPTYTNETIREFAKIFTGLSYGGRGPRFGRSAWDDAVGWSDPMLMFKWAHEPGEKHLLRGYVTHPALSGMGDIEKAIDNLFEHPNVGPFIGRRLIQRLVTSNPTPEYVERISAVFADDGQGVRGNLFAVVRAILLDPEARDPAMLDDPEHGRLREPILRVVRLLRTFPPTRPVNLDLIEYGNPLAQIPLRSPSVFNFFQPDFAPGGAIRDAGLYAPEFQITNSNTSIAWANIALRLAEERSVEDVRTGRRRSLRMKTELRLARNPEALVDRFDLLLTHGTLSPGTRDAILWSINRLTDPGERLTLTLYLFLISPDWNVIQ